MPVFMALPASPPLTASFKDGPQVLCLLGGRDSRLSLLFVGSVNSQFPHSPDPPSRQAARSLARTHPAGRQRPSE